MLLPVHATTSPPAMGHGPTAVSLGHAPVGEWPTAGDGRSTALLPRLHRPSAGGDARPPLPTAPGPRVWVRDGLWGACCRRRALLGRGGSFGGRCTTWGGPCWYADVGLSFRNETFHEGRPESVGGGMWATDGG